ncbi:Fumarate reductase cytochrome b subunit [Gammaproteobacteria bacterium]
MIKSTNILFTNQIDRWPARLEWIQSGTGLLLGTFICLHTFFAASILLGPKMMWRVSRFFEGKFLFGSPYPVLVSILGILLFLLLLAHSAVAIRKLPPQTWRVLWHHAKFLHHTDTWLWMVQKVTGFLMFFLIPIHLYPMITHPGRIGPFESADRVWTARLWPLDLLLILTVLPHACIGLYRLVLKWGWPSVSRKVAHRMLWGTLILFLVMDLASLGAYLRIGIDHAPRAGGLWRKTYCIPRE